MDCCRLILLFTLVGLVPKPVFGAGPVTAPPVQARAAATILSGVTMKSGIVRDARTGDIVYSGMSKPRLRKIGSGGPAAPRADDRMLIVVDLP